MINGMNDLPEDPPVGEPEGRKATASDVAALAGVSKWTVSRAFTEGASISPWARERVIQVAKELGYRPNLLARSLSKRRTHLVGLVVDEMANPNLLPVLDEVTQQLQAAGYLAILLNITGDQAEVSLLSLADQFQVEGLLFLGTTLTEGLVALAQDVRHIPLIVLYRNSEHPGIQVVTTDGYSAGRQVAALFLSQHYRRIGYMAGPVSESTQLRRLEGFRDGLSSAGLSIERVLDAGHYRREDGYRAMSGLLDEGADAVLDALFCENDILAIGAMDAMQERGQAGEMAIVGFDDIGLAAAPAYHLTTYRQPMTAMIAEAIRRLDPKHKAPTRQFIAGELVLRASHLRRAPGRASQTLAAV